MDAAGDTGAEALDTLMEMYPQAGDPEAQDVYTDFVKEYMEGLFAEQTELPATVVALRRWLTQVHQQVTETDKKRKEESEGQEDKKEMEAEQERMG